ncbi:MAG: PaaI family thioesterase [Holophaga sp.]
MATTIDPKADSLHQVCQRLHPDCFVCAPGHPFGLKVAFAAAGANQVEATFPCGWFWQGFPGKLHGGIVSSLLDSAMVHALMAKNIEAVTADLQVRFHLPVKLGTNAQVIGEFQTSKGPIHYLTARLIQDGSLRASARARFFEISAATPA